MTVRTFAQCIGIGAASFSVVGDLLGYCRLRAVTVSARHDLRRSSCVIAGAFA